MKKLIICLFIMFMVTGCSITKLENNELDNIINTISSKKINLYNRISKGYKYYLPKGVRILDYEEYNEKLYSKFNTYYLYVDIVSYHYKTNNVYVENSNSYFYKQLNDNSYIDIVQNGDKYLINYQYNYAKMEAIVDEKSIKDTISDMTYILFSLKYNDTAIDSFIGENVLNYKEEKFDIDKPVENEQTFLDYVNTYDTYKGDETVSEDNDTIDTKKDD